ncbi:Aste57867_8498 [Aphanomyces stellatus]|uniref:Aste57867_8498 protein n=1 Tax=Aphanomyces stellatus TaxID=120398 RepID=A0A485KKG0_9STRA|nr:hypothetical protein As57867_008466 [Aphanomyces stellatus]VFT85384.1 Aste57867_8498 [Aphanomyces stellatus]
MATSTRFNPVSLDLMSPPSKHHPSSSWDKVSNTSSDDDAAYDLIWTGGNLGVAFIDSPAVCVSRITGKGAPIGLDSVRPGDLLVSINEMDTRALSLRAVLKLLNECAMPATLHLERPNNQQPASPAGISVRLPQRLPFSPSSGTYSPTVTSPKNSNGPERSPLAHRPAAQWSKSPLQSPANNNGPRLSSPF